MQQRIGTCSGYVGFDSGSAALLYLVGRPAFFLGSRDAKVFEKNLAVSNGESVGVAHGFAAPEGRFDGVAHGLIAPDGRVAGSQDCSLEIEVNNHLDVGGLRDVMG